MAVTDRDRAAAGILQRSADGAGLDIVGGRVRRTSSRICLGVEHGDYNGTKLFGVGTDRFIWMAYKPNESGRIRILSANFPGDGVVAFTPGDVPEPMSASTADTWARFPFGVDHVFRHKGLKPVQGIDAVLYGDIPSGGMSRSASLTLNIILTLLEVNGITIEDPFEIVDAAQAVENEYIGSPCGKLDQIMILFAKEGTGTHYDPATGTVKYIPMGPGAEDLRIVVMDTGTTRPGLEKSTYKARRAECEALVELARGAGFEISSLADVDDPALYDRIRLALGGEHPELCDRLAYIYHAQIRFDQLLEAWRAGDIGTVGRLFRADGIGLRDDYRISGPELETMCDIARTVPGVLGERMLGGGGKGAAGALVRAESVDALKRAVQSAYPHEHPEYADKFAVHTCRVVAGVEVLEGLI